VNESKEPPAGLRFPRTAKLLKHSDFQRVYKSGKRHFSGSMTVFYLPRPDAADAGPRIGITVSRALGGAVDRNRIKRRMREAIRLHLAALTSSMDLVFNPKKVVATVAFAALEQEVSRSFEVIEKAAARMQAKERSNAP
jgi:ribonuclease P protein component